MRLPIATSCDNSVNGIDRELRVIRELGPMGGLKLFRVKHLIHTCPMLHFMMSFLCDLACPYLMLMRNVECVPKVVMPSVIIA